MGEVDHFSVTVSRVGESMHADPYFTMDGYSLTVGADGLLNIEGKQGGRFFSAGTWDDFEVKRIAARRS